MKDQSSKDLAVSQIMTDKSKLMTATPQQSVVDVMKLMTENNFRHVPVVGALYLPPNAATRVPPADGLAVEDCSGVKRPANVANSVMQHSWNVSSSPPHCAVTDSNALPLSSCRCTRASTWGW